jgi:hypothetical protein
MRGIAKLLFAGDEERLAGLLGGDEDWFRLAGQAREAGEWCGTTAGRGVTGRGAGGGRRERPVTRPAIPRDCWPG